MIDQATAPDLAKRSCPPGLQGALIMMVAGIYELAYRGGDYVGTQIYTRSVTDGFLYCVVAATITSALMLPVLLLVPKSLVATADGERNPAVEAHVLVEIGEEAPAR